jgi:hypothetical protein
MGDTSEACRFGRILVALFADRTQSIWSKDKYFLCRPNDCVVDVDVLLWFDVFWSSIQRILRLLAFLEHV